MSKNFMMDLEKETKNELSLTANGALAYRSSGEALLDFLFATTALREANRRKIQDRITDVYFENPLVANKFFFFERDCRGGNGERRIFREYLVWLAENKPEVAKAVIPLVPEYGRVDDLWCLLDTDLKDDVCEWAKHQIEMDIESCESGKPASLALKWFPSCCTSSKETRRYAEIIRKYLGLTPRQYRKTLSKLRAYLDVIEVKTSANRWGEINYEKVPSQANIKYSDAFMKHDKDRRSEYLESLKKGVAKINANVLQPHEIISKYLMDSWDTRVKSYDETLEQLWKALPDETVGNTLVVADTSGSMGSGYGGKVRPIDVAAGLAVYMSEHNDGIWKDKCLTFSTRPKFMDFSKCKSLHDKLVYYIGKAEVSDTNIERTMLLILQTAIKNNCEPEDMPKNILILSDCQFNMASRARGDGLKTLFENIAEEYKRNGYTMPRMVFWNLSGAVNNTIPMQENEAGLVLMSGFNVQLLHMVMSGKTDPYDVVLDVLNSPRYKAVEEAVINIC